MLNFLFDEEKNQQVIDYFLQNVAPLGKINYFEKDATIDPREWDQIYIVKEGYFKQLLLSSDGREITLFRLKPGTVFGEMDYFGQKRTIALTKALENSIAVSLSREILEKELEKNPFLYRCFIQSIIRKYRIILMKTARTAVNDSKGRVCGILLEISAQYGNDVKIPGEIDYVYTHQELANATACSRITITNILNELKDEGLISYRGRKIFIEDPEGLMKYFNAFW
jgi:CRP-like cAMP-binding protein